MATKSVIVARHIWLAIFSCGPALADTSVIISCDENAKTEQTRLLLSLSDNPSHSQYRFQLVAANGRIWPLTFLNFCDFQATIPDGEYTAELAGRIPDIPARTLAAADFEVHEKNIIVESQTGSISFAVANASSVRRVRKTERAVRRGAN